MIWGAEQKGTVSLIKCLDLKIDRYMRDMRQKSRDLTNAWVGNDAEGMIQEAEDLCKLLTGFTDYLKGKDNETQEKPIIHPLPKG